MQKKWLKKQKRKKKSKISDSETPETEKFKFICHRSCEYFPCHEVKNEDEFNCLFCYCPLYALGSECGGNFSYNEEGVKDCSNCMIPHMKGGYDYIMSKSKALIELAKKKL